MTADTRASRWRGLDLGELDSSSFRLRFWSKVDMPDDADACWEWQTYRQPAGYGQFTLRKGVFTGAHRVSFVLANGPLLPGDVVRHACDNPPCCNPRHLLRGTQRENSMDAVHRGRARRSHGEEHRDHRLTEEDVRHIRSLKLKYGDKSAVARQLGVSLTWMADALCAQVDNEIFFPERGGSTREAKRICLSCEVKDQCLEYALAHHEHYGIWGGLSERERRRLLHRSLAGPVQISFDVGHPPLVRLTPKQEKAALELLGKGWGIKRIREKLQCSRAALIRLRDATKNEVAA